LFSLQSSDVIKSSYVMEEIVKPVDIGSKFKFFEEARHQDKAEKKAFRITPPRDQPVRVLQLSQLKMTREDSFH